MKNKNKSNQEEQRIIKGLSQEELKKILTPKNDVIFKRLFGSKGKEKVLKSFLEAILEIKIEKVEIEAETLMLPEEIDEKVGILDLLVTLEDGTKVDIEMQNSSNINIIKRSHFYASRLYDKELKIGEKYRILNKVIIVFITNFKMFKDIEDYHTKWKMTEINNKEKVLDEIELQYIELPKFKEKKYNTKLKKDQWLLFLDYENKEVLKEIMEENEEIKEQEEEMEKIKKDKHQQYLAWLRLKYDLDMNSARADGVEDGIKEGIEKGIEKGKKELQKEIVIKMLEENISIEQIKKITNLSQKEIDKIIEENKKA